MGESLEHMNLVRELVKWSELHFSDKNPIILSDLPESIQKPPKIGRHIPDLYARDMTTGEIIIGEAKRIADYTKKGPHKRAVSQLEAFISHLEMEKRGILVIAVPFYIESAFEEMIVNIKKNYNCKNFKYFFTRESLNS